MIIRNRDEILDRAAALGALQLPEGSKHCLLAVNGNPGDLERVQSRFAYLRDIGYHLFTSTNYQGGLFPAVDFYNAFELVICGASYNSFWETIYFNKEAIYVPTRTRFVRSERLIEQYRDYSFTTNGADQLVDIILQL